MTATEEILPIKEVYYHPLQIEVSMVQAHTAALVWPRGQGKTTAMAHRFSQCAIQMPGSLGAMIAPSYTKLLKDTLPALISGLARLGYHQNIHYYVGRYAPDSRKWGRPLDAPIKSDHFIHFYSGTVCNFISQDVAGSGNGPSYDWYVNDEAKFTDKKKLDEEFIPTLRGNVMKFKDCGMHQGGMYITDMPGEAEGKWIFEMEALMDKTQISLIKQIQAESYELQRKALDPEYKESSRAVYGRKARRYDRILAELRRGHEAIDIEDSRPPSVFYSEPKREQILNNLDFIGVKYYREMQRKLSKMSFSMSILNERMTKVDDGFYPSFDPDIHGYIVKDGPYIRDIDHTNAEGLAAIGHDCRTDYDLVPGAPLCMGADYGARINCCVIAQEMDGRVNFLKDFYVGKGDKIEQLVEMVCEYYRFHNEKVVWFPYDHTAIADDAMRTSTYAEEYRKCFEQRGWTVIDDYRGQAPNHHVKYEVIDAALRRTDIRLPKLRYNKVNCSDMANSIMMAPMKLITIKGRTILKKDKSSEQSTKIDAKDATHFSDAFDTLVYNIYKPIIEGKPTGSGVIFPT